MNCTSYWVRYMQIASTRQSAQWDTEWRVAAFRKN